MTTPDSQQAATAERAEQLLRRAERAYRESPSRDRRAVLTMAYSLARASLASAQPADIGAAIPESAILHRMKYHRWEADPAIPDDVPDWELFDADIDCEHCIDVLIVRADAASALAASPSPVSVHPIRSPTVESPAGGSSAVETLGGQTVGRLDESKP